MRHKMVGPVAVITVGVLFLVQEFTRFDFGETWPVLLVAIGVAMLLQHYNASEPPASTTAATQSTSDKVNHG